MNPSVKNCHCGTPVPYSVCCEPYHKQLQKPETAEKLMRSRYSAYAAGKIDYIDQTNEPKAGESFDREAAEAWSRKSEWMGLEIVSSRDGKKGDAQGEVEFKARFKTDGKEQVHHEVSLFHFDAKASQWYYVDGKEIHEPIRRTEPKAGRNDPCPCGSGKKLKKCCG